ncbi:hypothetical protein CY34DRAFT_19986 [Suillus luteus UH-Slu-Lm8-n1]|uniref:Uncharacterized protein n=1 Tax=Suillus luteus UH-Slu-Lm8-n1 TaxID=930992 RepID=A0A0C9Z1J5_9AGAM|nr:hypothetical protein CY34DRAFT_19986 [Suillus luteus UH-Slu-Lm8-n1]
MSHRPTITSHISHAEGRRRRLTPMRNNHPNLHRLKRCSSLEWIHNTDRQARDASGGLVIRVGEDVSIYPLDERAVQLQDGSLPVTSYWYGKVVEIYLKPGRQVQGRAARSQHSMNPH